MKLSELAKEIAGGVLKGDAEVRGLTADSRVVGEGDLFLCFQGKHVDSHVCAAEAQARGCAAVVCEHALALSCAQLIVPDGREAMARISAAFYHHPERTMKMIGVTGTNGKTTTATMIANILNEAGIRTGLIGTLGASYAAVKVAPSLTTPDPIGLFSLLADMARAGTQAVVMEVSAHALALKKEAPVCYDVAVFTNLTRDHLDDFGDMEQYGNAKRALFCKGKCRFAVLNADDAFSRTLAKGVRRVTYGLETPADAFAVVRRDSLRGCCAILNLQDELCEAEIPMTGRHNLSNALAAACTARRLGAGMEAIAKGLAKTVVDGRLEWAGAYRGGDVFVDFAHTPDGLEKSLTALREHCAGRLIALFGCGGNRDAGKRAAMGETAAKFADFSVLTSDNPRYEDPYAIISQIEAGYRRVSEEYVVVEEREHAIAYAIGLLSDGDVLLIAGKGGEKYQEIMGIKYDYEDKAVVRSIIGKS